MAEEKPKTITVGQAATLLNKTERFVEYLVSYGFVLKSKKGQYSLTAVIHGYVDYMDQKLAASSKSAAASRVTDARTRLLEIGIAERQRQLIPLDDAKAVMAQFAAQVRAELTGMPARLTRSPAERLKLKPEVDGALRRLS